MSDPLAFDKLFGGDLEGAVETFELEQEKLRQFQRALDEAKTVVRSKDRMLSVTFDGRGELTAVKFHSEKYRQMAPAELANALVQVFAEGRAKAMATMAELDGAPRIPGLDFAELASGKVDVDQMMQALLGPMFDNLTGPSTKD